MDTLISGQLYLRPPSQNPIFLNSHTNSVRTFTFPFVASSSNRHLFHNLRVSAQESFHLQSIDLSKKKLAATNHVWQFTSVVIAQNIT